MKTLFLVLLALLYFSFLKAEEDDNNLVGYLVRNAGHFLERQADNIIRDPRCENNEFCRIIISNTHNLFQDMIESDPVDDKLTKSKAYLEGAMKKNFGRGFQSTGNEEFTIKNSAEPNDGEDGEDFCSDAPEESTVNESARSNNKREERAQEGSYGHATDCTYCRSFVDGVADDYTTYYGNVLYDDCDTVQCRILVSNAKRVLHDYIRSGDIGRRVQYLVKGALVGTTKAITGTSLFASSTMTATAGATLSISANFLAVGVGALVAFQLYRIDNQLQTMDRKLDFITNKLQDVDYKLESLHNALILQLNMIYSMDQKLELHTMILMSIDKKIEEGFKRLIDFHWNVGVLAFENQLKSFSGYYRLELQDIKVHQDRRHHVHGNFSRGLIGEAKEMRRRADDLIAIAQTLLAEKEKFVDPLYRYPFVMAILVAWRTKLDAEVVLEKPRALIKNELLSLARFIREEAYALLSPPSTASSLPLTLHRLAVEISQPLATYKLLYDTFKAQADDRIPIFMSKGGGLSLYPSTNEFVVVIDVLDPVRVLYSYDMDIHSTGAAALSEIVSPAYRKKVEMHMNSQFDWQEHRHVTFVDDYPYNTLTKLFVPEPITVTGINEALNGLVGFLQEVAEKRTKSNRGRGFSFLSHVDAVAAGILDSIPEFIRSDDESELQRAFGATDILENLVKILNLFLKMDSYSLTNRTILLVKGLEAISWVTYNNDGNRSKYGSIEGSIEALVDVLKVYGTTNADVAKACCNAIGRITARNDGNRSKYGYIEGSIEALVAVLKVQGKNQSYSDAVGNCCGAIYRLCTGGSNAALSNKNKFNSLNTIHILTNDVTVGNDMYKNWAINALRLLEIKPLL